MLTSVASRFPTLREASPLRQRVYLDTFDRRLDKAGMRLSCTTVAGVSALQLETPGGGMDCRVPNGAPPAFAGDFPAGPLQARAAPIIQLRRLLPLVTVESAGQAVKILDERQKTVARIVIERATVTTADGEAANAEPAETLRLVPVRGYAGAMRRVCEHITAELGQTPMPWDSLVRALAPPAAGSGKNCARYNLALVPDQDAGQAIAVICRQLLDTIVSNEDGVRRDLDVEFLHDFRVAIRCTRSALAQFKKVFPADSQARFGGEFKWLGAATSALRDMDVYLKKIDAYRATAPASAAQDLAALEKYLRRQRATARRRLLAVLHARRYRRLLEDWRSFLDASSAWSVASPAARRPVLEVASRRIWRAYRRVQRRGARINDSSSAETLHDLRIDGKKLRYLLTFFSDLYDREDIRPLQKKLRRLQDNLGDFNDLAVQQGILQHFAREMQAEGLASADCLLSMGRLLEHLLEAQIRERRRFAECFRQFSIAQNAQRFRRLFRPSEPRREPVPG